MCDSLFCTTFVGNNFHSDIYEYLTQWIKTRTEIHVGLHEKVSVVFIKFWSKP